jgi:FdhD protein
VASGEWRVASGEWLGTWERGRNLLFHYFTTSLFHYFTTSLFHYFTINMKSTQPYEGLRANAAGSERVKDELTLEHPLSIRIGGEAFMMTMHTPADELDLVRGILFTEGVARKKEGALEIEVVERSENGFISVVNVPANEVDLQAAQLNKRSLLSVASCGICGKTSLNLPEGRLLGDNGILDAQMVVAMFATMKEQQSAYLSGGGSHGAAIFNAQHAMLAMREDIGRHNAVDKAIGALLNGGNLNQGRYLLVSGRVSYEIVVKCFAAGIPNLLAVSAPSSLAVDFCKELGIALYGFCRDGRFTCYSA